MLKMWLLQEKCEEREVTKPLLENIKSELLNQFLHKELIKKGKVFCILSRCCL